MNPSNEWQKWEPHGSQAQHENPWQDFEEPQKAWRDFDRLQGWERFEFSVPVQSIVQLAKKLFGRKRK